MLTPHVLISNLTSRTSAGMLSGRVPQQARHQPPTRRRMLPPAPID